MRALCFRGRRGQSLVDQMVTARDAIASWRDGARVAGELVRANGWTTQAVATQGRVTASYRVRWVLGGRHGAHRQRQVAAWLASVRERRS